MQYNLRIGIDLFGNGRDALLIRCPGQIARSTPMRQTISPARGHLYGAQLARKRRPDPQRQDPGVTTICFRASQIQQGWSNIGKLANCRI